MAHVNKYGIKINELNLFFSNGGWKATIEDATKFDTVEQAKTKAISLNKPGLVIVTIKVNTGNGQW